MHTRKWIHTWNRPRSSVRLWVSAAFSLIAGTAGAQSFPPEAAWRPFLCGGRHATDAVKDQSGAFQERDVVGTVPAPAALRASDADFLYLRLRVDETPVQGNGLRPFAWGFAFSVDGDARDYEALATLNGGTGDVQLYRNTTTTINDSPEDPADVPAVASFPASSHGRALQAESELGGSPDHFVQMALPWSELNKLGIARDKALVVWAASSSEADRLNGDFACHDAGGGMNVARLADAASEAERADGAGGTGGSGNGGGASGGEDGPTLEGGPGCAWASGSSVSTGALVIGVLAALGMRRWRRKNA